MYCSVLSATVSGMEMIPVQVEADVSDGMPQFTMVGYVSAQVKEAQDRVRTALKNMGISLPPKRITINLSPADVRKEGSRFDLPIAAGVLMTLGRIPPRSLRKTMVLGELGLDGHSDADVLLHAVTDAVLGAAALGDIGQHFPPSDPKWKGADSRVLLRAVVALARLKGWIVVNCDATIVAERPKIGPHMPAIRASLAETLGVSEEEVNVKAKTNERMDAVGRMEGMMAQAVVLMSRMA